MECELFHFGSKGFRGLKGRIVWAGTIIVNSWRCYARRFGRPMFQQEGNRVGETFSPPIRSPGRSMNPSTTLVTILSQCRSAPRSGLRCQPCHILIVYRFIMFIRLRFGQERREDSAQFLSDNRLLRIVTTPLPPRLSDGLRYGTAIRPDIESRRVCLDCPPQYPVALSCFDRQLRHNSNQQCKDTLFPPVPAASCPFSVPTAAMPTPTAATAAPHRRPQSASS